MGTVTCNSHTKYSRCTKDRKEKGYCYFPLLLLFYCLPVLQALLPQASSHYWSVFYTLTKEICKKSKVSHLHLMGAHLLLSYTAIHLTKHEPSGPEGPRTPPLNPKLNTLRTLPPLVLCLQPQWVTPSLMHSPRGHARNHPGCCFFSTFNQLLTIRPLLHPDSTTLGCPWSNGGKCRLERDLITGNLTISERC